LSIIDLIKERIVLLDGAMGSLLISQGLSAGTPPEAWNKTKPEKIQKIHLDYFNAGSDIVLTNTFGGSRLKLAAHKEGRSVEELNKAAVELAIKICPEDKFIAGDIGPSGTFLPPVGTISIKDLEDNFLEQSKYLAEAGIDLFFIETMVDIKEAEIAVKAAKKISNLPVFASITFQKTKKGYFTIMGNTVEQCVKTLQNAGADAIGANCTIGSSEMIGLIEEINQVAKLPIIAKPNAGMPILVGGKTRYPTTPENFAKDIFEIINNQAKIIGGCCGTNPLFIEKITQILQRGVK
jgi:5-methyltetrahydrofolate--homocysteine methyltransferase